jgi:hypothetical protein
MAGRHELYKSRSKAGTVHHAAEHSDLPALSAFITEGLGNGNPESVTLQQREEVSGGHGVAWFHP